MFVPNQRVRIILSPAEQHSDYTADVGRLGTVLAVDHPSAGLARSLTVVMDPCHSPTEEKLQRSLGFFDPSQVEPA